MLVRCSKNMSPSPRIGIRYPRSLAGLRRQLPVPRQRAVQPKDWISLGQGDRSDVAVRVGTLS